MIIECPYCESKVDGRVMKNICIDILEEAQRAEAKAKRYYPE
jgi:hypothetical protein